MVLFRSSLSFFFSFVYIFCQLLRRRLLKSPSVTVDLSVSPLRTVKHGIIYFETHWVNIHSRSFCLPDRLAIYHYEISLFYH